MTDASFLAMTAGLGAPVPQLLLWLLLAAAAAVGCRALRLPESLGVLTAGAVLLAAGRSWAPASLMPGTLGPPLLLPLLLPPILFGLALRAGRQAAPTSLALALRAGFLAVLLGVGVVGYAAWRLLSEGLPDRQLAARQAALVLAVALLPMETGGAVLVRRLGAGGRRLLAPVEIEAAVVAVAAVVLLGLLGGWIDGSLVTVHGALGRLLWEVGVGGLVGLACGVVLSRALARRGDSAANLLLALVAAYGTWTAAQWLGASGAVACGVTGWTLARRDRAVPSALWLELLGWCDVLAVLGSAVAVALAATRFDVSELLWSWRPVATLLVIGLGARAAAVWLGARWAGCRPAAEGVDLTLLWWAGMRSPVGLILLVSLYYGLSPGLGASMSPALVLGFGVMLASLLLQALSVPSMIRTLGLGGQRPFDERLEHLLAARRAVEASRAELEALRLAGELSPEAEANLAAPLEAQLRELRTSIEASFGALGEYRVAQEERAARRVLATQRAAIDDLLSRRLITEDTYRLLVADIEAREAGGRGLTFDRVEQDTPKR